MMRKAITLILTSSFTSLCALPTGEQVVHGKASTSRSSDHRSLTVDAHGKSIIEWDRFDISRNEMVSFVQSQSKSAVLNRVTGDNKSYILGNLTANCPLFLVNGKGVFIGSGAQINTAGFIASTADISNENFLRQDSLIFENLTEGKIVNLGKVSSSQGDVLLVARLIKNEGTIDAPEGLVTLATTEVVVNPGAKQQVFIRLGENSVDEERIENRGDIKALVIDFKTNSPYSRAIHHTGNLEALKAVEESGRIFLVAEKGGCDIEGKMSTPGGKINVKGRTIEVSSKGELLANALEEGDGGEITLWAEEKTSFLGKAQARGGEKSGNGGTIRISTAGEDFAFQGDSDGFVDVTAQCGRTGDVVLDPKFVVINETGTDSATGNTFASDPTGTATISGSTLETALNSANVTIQANTDILFDEVKVEATTINHGLTLQAGRSIEFRGDLTLNDGAFLATINDAGAEVANRDAGTAQFTSYGGFTQIITQGGDITVDVGTFGGSQIGEVVVSDGIFDAGGGNISITGVAVQDNTNNGYGVIVGGLAEVKTSGTGTITMNGTGGNGPSGNVGVYIAGGQTLIQAEDGLIHVTGDGGGNGTGNGNTGVLSAALIESTGTGGVTFDGTAGSGVTSNSGVCLIGGSPSEIRTVDGPILLNGTGDGTEKFNFGVRFESGASCVSTGTGTITLVGDSGIGTDNNHGVILSNGSLSSVDGKITVTGTGQGLGDFDYGVRLETGAYIESTGTAPIEITGDNVQGKSYNVGVSISSFGNNGEAISSVDGDITINGDTMGTEILNQGVRIESGKVIGSDNANVTITGVGGPGTDYCNGISIEGSSSGVHTFNGDIDLTGTSTGTGKGNKPVLINPPSSVSSANGTVTINEN